ncbi:MULTISPECIES: glycoside hydrolase family 65 protein [Catenuloplanes]|uniref:Alpha,alpha-trehalose phosphorylase n=1 Tax=Catenuloplanes niger TaxID=587534 RepID=A0AAE3ZLN2_9ACTN|nr:glycosyl hydrolase family 65 protein [Catenuloplanes niger]MDR7320438.1 alpha,alpha-trehalose phosphorylase [Catenuloplanes niger]
MSEIGAAEPWAVRETGVPDDDRLRQRESVFALANGHIGLRGNLDEPEICGMPGTYLNSLFEERDLSYPEEGYAFPKRTETIVDAPNAKPITLTVGGERFDVRTGTVTRHERVLDLRRGTLVREVEWVSPNGVRLSLRTERLVSFTRPSIAAIRYVARADAPLRAESDLRVNEEPPEQRDDPRASEIIPRPFESVSHDRDALVHHTRRSKITVAVAATHVGADGTATSEPDLLRWTAEGHGELRFDKIVAYRWGGDEDVRAAALQERDAAAEAGFDVLADEQCRHLEAFWADADVEIDGDPEVQQAVRFGLFHVLQAGALSVPGPVPAKGLTGNGYDGHTLWDTEIYVLPVLTYTHPEYAERALRWRHHTLGHARDRARELGLSGAAFAWRTISGPECSGYWPAGTAGLHVNADIAGAVLRYHAATGDETFMREAGRELIDETARLWVSVSHLDADGVAHIVGVTGPDEYSALMDDNVYTNLMAQQNLRAAALDEHSLEIADRIAIPYDERHDVHDQSAGFTRLEEWNFPGDRFPLMLHHPYLNLYRRQVVKQADLVLAMLMRGDVFTPEQKRRNFDYYEARTVRDSSLSAPVQAVLAAETGYLSLAHAYLAEAALLDLRGDGESGGDGLHIAACAGAWMALVMGFGGLRDCGGRLSFAPRLAPGLSRLRFRVRWRRARLTVTVTPGEVTYTARGDAVTFDHEGTEVTVADGDTATFPLAPVEDRPAPPSPRPPAPR